LGAEGAFFFFGNGNQIIYLYNATGQKVSKKVEADAITTTDYLNGFQYTNAKLNFFPHAEGYVNVTEFKSRLNYNYVFNYTDHLGNIRLSYATDPTTATLKVIEENHYYPFGLKHTNYNSDKLTYIKREENLRIGQLEITPILIDDVRGEYNYKYNGKEYQDELGLNVTAMDFRMYDSALGRFHNIDKMADIMPSLTPYRFGFNNPVMWSDPTGLFESGGGDEDEEKIPYIQGPEVTVGISSSSSSDIRPANFTYDLINWRNVDESKRPTLEQYNQYHGTNFQTFDDYYYHMHYKPARKKMISQIHGATGQAAKVCYVVAATLLGTAYLAPILISASPAIQSSLATVVTNPSVQTFMYGGVSEYAGMNITANIIGQGVGNGGDISKINLLEAAESGFNGFAPLVIGSTFNLSISDVGVNNQTKIAAGIGTGFLGGGLKNQLQLPNSIMTNTSFATYQGMINTTIDASTTFTTNQIEKKHEGK
jgi:RHS repeat-associated protein